MNHLQITISFCPSITHNIYIYIYSFSEILLFILQIVKALEHLHRNLSVIHRGNQKIKSQMYRFFSSFLVLYVLSYTLNYVSHQM